MYFGRNREDRMASTNGIIPRGRLNADGRRERSGVPGRTLEAVLDHIETGNTPRLEYPPRSSFSHRRGSSWMLRRMEPGTSSSSGSGSLSSGSPALRPVKPEPEETPLRRRSRSSALVTNKGA